MNEAVIRGVADIISNWSIEVFRASVRFSHGIKSMKDYLL